jgi:alkylation response protein AidB-like acyl-CoA dehydrogenase
VDVELSEEQQLLRETANRVLGDRDTLAEARAALDGIEPVGLWKTVFEAGWADLTLPEDHGGDSLAGIANAVIVLEACGGALANPQLIGHLASSILAAVAGLDGAVTSMASGQRAAYIATAPPDDRRADWTALGPRGAADSPLLEVGQNGTVSGTAEWVLDAPGADIFVGVARSGSNLVAVSVEGSAQGVTIEPAVRYDATRPLARVTFESAVAAKGPLEVGDAGAGWYAAQVFVAAESLGAAIAALNITVAYVKDRQAFGRSIGSYQAVKHGLTEALRMIENARSLVLYAAWAATTSPDEFPLVASAARSTAGRAQETAVKAMFAFHGGIGATWEHDTHLFYRRAQLNRLLLGGTRAATDRVASEMMRRESSLVPV